MKIILTFTITNILLFATPLEIENTPSQSIIVQKQHNLTQLREKLNKIETRLNNSEKALYGYNIVLQEKQDRLTTLIETQARCNNHQLKLDGMIKNNRRSTIINTQRELVETCKKGYDKRVDFFRNLTVLLNNIGSEADDLKELAKIDRDTAYELKSDIAATLSEIEALKKQNN